jgi:hypothetical protein
MISVDMRPPIAARVPDRRAGPAHVRPDTLGPADAPLRARKAEVYRVRGIVRAGRSIVRAVRTSARSGGRAELGLILGLLAGCQLAGCQRPQVVDVPTPGPDEVQYAGTLVYREGLRGLELLRIDDGGLLRPGERRVTRTASGARSLAVWQIDRRAFVHPDGRALTAAEFETLVIRAAATPASPDRGTCGRCLVPNAGKPPLVVHSGSSCAPPTEGVTVSLDDRAPDSRDQLRQLALEAVRFEWAGGCACPLGELSSDVPVRARVLDTAPRAHLVRIPTASGAVALVDEQGGVLADGVSQRALGRLPEGLGLVGVALGSGPDPAMLAGVLRGRLQFDLLWVQYDEASGMWLERLRQPSIEPFAARATPTQPGQFVVLGQLRDIQKSAVVQACSSDARGCADVLDRTSRLFLERFVFATALADGGWVFATDGGDLAYVDRIPSLSSAFASPPVPDGPGLKAPQGDRQLGRTGRAPDVARWGVYGLTNVVTSSAGAASVGTIHGLASVGQRVYACLSTDDAEPSDRRLLIVSRELSPSVLDLDDDGPNLGLRVEACRSIAEGVCRGLVTTGTVVHALLDHDDGYQVLTFDRHGPLDDEALRTPSCRPYALGQRPRAPTVRFADRPFQRFQQVSAGAWLGVLPRGDVLRVDGAGRRWLYGDGVPAREWMAAVSDEAGGAWLLGPAGYLARWSESTGLVTTAVADLPAIRAAALDHSEPAPRLGLVVITADGRAARVSVDVARGHSRVDVLHDPPTVRVVDELPRRFEAVQVVEAVPGVHIAIAGLVGNSGSEIWRLRRGEAAEITQKFGDDPRTPELDSAPSSDVGCDFVPRFADLILNGAGQRTLRSLASSQGVVWAAGCGGELYRIVAGTPELSIERHAPTRWRFRPDSPMNLCTVSAVCPDQLVLGAEEDTTSGTTSRVRILGVVPTGRPEALSRLDQDVVVIEGLGSEPREGLVDRGGAHALFVGGRAAVIVLSGSDGDAVPGTVGRLGAARGQYLAGAPLTSVRVAGDKVLVALQGGTLVLVEPEQPR